MRSFLLLLLFIFCLSCEKEASDFIEDTEGNRYPVVQIGAQTWMAENLRSTHFNDGTSIPQVISNEKWKWLKTSAYCFFRSEDYFRDIYGLLYNWYALTDSCELCPEGWRVPTTEDWEDLIRYLGGADSAGGKMKAVDTILWDIPNVGATNESGFSALPGGYRNQNSDYVGLGFRGSFWSRTIYNETCAEVMITERRYAKARIDFATFEHGYYVRCIKAE